MIKKIWVKGYRNLKEDLIKFENPDHLLISGENNQGKTNFLEAVYFLFHGVSPLTDNFQHLITLGLNEAVLGADYGVDEQLNRLYLKLDQSGKKQLSLNNKIIKSFTSISSTAPVDYLSAEVIRIFMENPSQRRKTLDQFCQRQNLKNRSLFREYERVVQQKNRLLKDQAADQALEIWNTKLAILGENILQARFAAFNLLQQKLLELFSQISKIKVRDVQFIYQYFGWLEEQKPQNNYRKSLEEKLQSNTQKERNAGFALYGPHRDDYRINLNGQDLFSFFSRGINLVSAILFKAAQLLMLAAHTGNRPTLLLDDTLAELDRGIRQEVLHLLASRLQIIYTTVLPEDKLLIPEAQALKMTQGVLVRE